MFGQGVQDGASGVIPGIAGAPKRVGEGAAPVRQLIDCRRCLAGHDLDHARVAQEIALAQGVGEVLLPRVPGIDGAKCRVDPAGGEHGMGI